MKINLSARAAVLAAALSLWALPSMAQVSSLDQLAAAQDSEIYCVADELASDPDDGFYVVVEAFLYDDNVEKAETALLKAMETCIGRYKWDAAKQELAIHAGMSSAVVDYLMEELYADGAKDEHIEAIERAAGKLSDEEIKRFADPDWYDDDAVVTRLNALLVAEKFPADDEYNLETARLIIEAHISQASAAWEWVQTYINKKN